jgi:hypothetical protein
MLLRIVLICKDNMYICYCNGAIEREIRAAVELECASVAGCAGPRMASAAARD